MIPKTMKGVQLTGHGGPEMLVWNDAIPVPAPKRGDALVRVLAAGVNNTDINTRTGWYAREVRGATDSSGGDSAPDGGWSGALPFPLIQGGDLCGQVVAVGPDTDEALLGRRVICPNVQAEPAPDAPWGARAIGSEYDGAFAEYCVVPVRHLYDVTEAPLSDVELGAMPCAFGTANGLVIRSGIAAGQRVLITGASGGVGLAAVQLAAIAGARVTGVTSSAKAEAVRGAGAEETLDRGATPPPAAFDVVIDIVGGPGFPAILDALARGGTYATSGAIAGPIVEVDLRTLYLMDLRMIGCTYQEPAHFRRLVDQINAGRVRPLVSQTYPLSEIARAQSDFAAKTHPGKLVLIPPDPA